jgi:acyl-CoA synthetase (AMP-forming)/AMP-acid ligase II
MPSPPRAEIADELLGFTVPELLAQRAQDSPHRLALSTHSARGFRDRLTYLQLVICMKAMGRAFDELGLRRGERVAVLLGNDAGRECILTALGALVIGAVIVPMNVRYSEEELAHALALTEPQVVVTTPDRSAGIHQLRPEATVLVVPGPGVRSEVGLPWPEPELQPPGRLRGEAGSAEQLACLLFTSGTTARSKAVMHTHRTMIATGLCCGTALGLTDSDLYQGAFPFFTSSALNLGCMSSWVCRAGFILEEPLDNARRLQLITTEGTTFYHGVPSIISFMLQEYGKGTYDLQRLRRVAYGGAAMPGEIVERIARTWPWLDQTQIYGLTETGPTGSVLPPDEVARKAGSVGRAMQYCRIRVLDENGNEAATDIAGEIAIAGPAVAAGYYRDGSATASAFSQGEVRTGDIGFMDEDGFLFFTDRKKDVINRGGLKIASVSVESVLYRHPDVREAAVVAVPHADLGEDVAACIVPRAGAQLQPSILAAFCRGKLSDYEVPRHWRFLDELPKNPMGKVLKTELRRLLASPEGGDQKRDRP